MMRELEDGAIELQIAPRKLGIALGGVLLIFGALGALAAVRAKLSGGAGLGPIFFSLMLAALGAVTYATARGVRVVLDKRRKLLTAQTLAPVGGAKVREVAFSEVKELALLGSTTAVGLYAQFGVADDLFIGRFGRTLPERQELGRWMSAVKAAMPEAKLVVRPELETEWLK